MSGGRCLLEPPRAPSGATHRENENSPFRAGTRRISRLCDPQSGWGRGRTPDRQAAAPVRRRGSTTGLTGGRGGAEVAYLGP